MNIGFYIPSLQGGGEEKRVRDISQFLARQGHAVHVFCDGPGQPALCGVRVVTLPGRGRLRLARNAAALRQQLRAQDIAVLFCFKRVGSVMGFVLEHFGGKAQIFGNIANTWPGKVLLNRLTPRRMISIHEDLNSQFPARLRIHMIPIGVARPDPGTSARRARSDGGPCQLLFVGGLSAQKRPERLLQLAAELRRRDFAFHLSILGQGPLKASLKAEASALGLARPANTSPFGVTFVDHVPPTEHYLACDFLLLTSDYEGLPNVILEAGALGRCVLATDVGAVGSVLANGRGRAFARFDAAAYANAITELYDSAECIAMGQRLRDFVVEHHNQADMLRGYQVLAEHYAR